VEHFFDWIRQHQSDKPWLILGKGPSFGLRTRFDLDAYHLLSLNHAVREQPVLLAHMIDLDVAAACGETLIQNARYVILPWFPHVGHEPGTRSLAEIASDHGLLRRLADDGRLLWYDLSTTTRRHGPGPVVHATYFSAEAAVDLLALAGVPRVRSLGVDGGATYSADFEDLTGRTLLANGQPGFDLQFRGIARTLFRTGLDFAPLDQPAPLVVAISTTPATALPERVLEFAIQRRASMTVRVHRTRPGDDGAGMLAGELDRIITLRPDSLVLDDLRKLWTRPRNGPLVEVPQGSRDSSPAFSAVSVMTGRDANAPVTASLPRSWDRRDEVVRDNTSLVWFAAKGLQPWVSCAHPFGHLWVAELLQAVREGFITTDEVRAEAGLGHVRPSLVEQVERNSPEPVFLSRAARKQDGAFSPPDGIPAKPLTSPRVILGAIGRSVRRGLARARRFSKNSRAESRTEA
jgi:hypothetical protein